MPVCLARKSRRFKLAHLRGSAAELKFEVKEETAVNPAGYPFGITGVRESNMP